jgi:hypothetical protein
MLPTRPLAFRLAYELKIAAESIEASDGSQRNRHLPLQSGFGLVVRPACSLGYVERRGLIGTVAVVIPVASRDD